jgi:hypothetical protein
MFHIPDWVELKFDTQIAGALLQMLAAGIVAWFVQRARWKDRRQSLAIELDRDWNTAGMIEARRRVHTLAREQGSPPNLGDQLFQDFWMIVMFFRRLAAFQRGGLLDPEIFRTLLSEDAGQLAAFTVYRWGEGVGRSEISLRDLQLISPDHQQLFRRYESEGLMRVTGLVAKPELRRRRGLAAPLSRFVRDGKREAAEPVAKFFRGPFASELRSTEPASTQPEIGI